jgi:hypothetical protein
LVFLVLVGTGPAAAEYGKQIVAALGRELEAEFGRGYGEKNLQRMVQLAEAFPDENIKAYSSLQNIRREISAAEGTLTASESASILVQGCNGYLPSITAFRDPVSASAIMYASSLQCLVRVPDSSTIRSFPSAKVALGAFQGATDDCTAEASTRDRPALSHQRTTIDRCVSWFQQYGGKRAGVQLDYGIAAETPLKRLRVS